MAPVRRMNGWLIAGTVVASIGLVLVLAGGGGPQRAPGTGAVTSPAEPTRTAGPKPQRGWVEWLGLGLAVGGFVTGIVGLFLG